LLLLLLRQGTAGVVRLTRDHRPDLPEERRRIEALGGSICSVIRGNGARVGFVE